MGVFARRYLWGVVRCISVLGCVQVHAHELLAALNAQLLVFVYRRCGGVHLLRHFAAFVAVVEMVMGLCNIMGANLVS